MNRVVVDASVAAKWVLPPAGEPLGGEALALLRRYAAGEVGFLVPDLFWAELANIFWKAIRQRRLTRAAADDGLAALRACNFPTVPTNELLESAFALAVAYGRSVYDALYLARALETGAPLVTADERLAYAVAARLPVRWLGALPG